MSFDVVEALRADIETLETLLARLTGQGDENDPLVKAIQSVLADRYADLDTLLR